MSRRQLALAAAVALLGPSASAAPPEGPRIAILPLVVHAMDGHDYLRSGLADMLASRIGSVPGVSVTRVEDPAAATSELARARAAARAVGADFVVFGSFTRFGEGASLDVQCARVGEDGEDGRQLFVQSGTLGEIIPKLDRLAAKITRFAQGEPPEAAPAAAGARRAAAAGDGRAELDELRQRVEELERALLERDSQRAQAPDLGAPDDPAPRAVR